MATHALAGQPAPVDMLIDVSRAAESLLRAPARPGRPAPARRLRDQRPPGHARATARSPRRTSWRSPRPSATTARRRGSPARCSWARTPTPSRARPSGPRWRCWPPTASRPCIQRDDGVTPTPVISRAILVHNRARRASRADGIVITPSHNPPGDGGFKYNPPHGGPADTDVTSWIQDRANALLRGRQRRGQAHPLRAGDPGRDDAPGRLRHALRRGPGERDRHGRDPLRRPEAGRRPAGRRGGPLLGADRRPVRPGHHRHEPGGRPDLPVHDARPRRQDPDGLLQPLRDGRPGRAQGPVRRRLRQRPRHRPPRHRHPVGGPDEPEPLPRRRDPLPADPPPRLARGRGGRQDAGQQRGSSTGSSRGWAGRSPRCRSASSGSCRACSTAPTASAARRAPGPASCGATGRPGRPTRTA